MWGFPTFSGWDVAQILFMYLLWPVLGTIIITTTAAAFLPRMSWVVGFVLGIPLGLANVAGAWFLVWFAWKSFFRGPDFSWADTFWLGVGIQYSISIGMLSAIPVAVMVGWNLWQQRRQRRHSSNG